MAEQAATTQVGRIAAPPNAAATVTIGVVAHGPRSVVFGSDDTYGHVQEVGTLTISVAMAYSWDLRRNVEAEGRHVTCLVVVKDSQSVSARTTEAEHEMEATG